MALLDLVYCLQPIAYAMVHLGKIPDFQDMWLSSRYETPDILPPTLLRFNRESMESETAERLGYSLSKYGKYESTCSGCFYGDPVVSSKPMTSFSASTYHKAAEFTMKPVVIGENMNRVTEYAQAHGYQQYGGLQGFVSGRDESRGLEHNRQWVRQKMQEGRAFVDVGPDFIGRGNAERYEPSVAYIMERRELSSYQNYQKDFERMGKIGGNRSLHQDSQYREIVDGQRRSLQPRSYSKLGEK